MPKPNERDLLKAEFAGRLKRLMEDKGWNQSDLARAASKYLPKGEEFRRDSISCYLNRLQIPRAQHLNAVAKAFGVEARDLLPEPTMAKDMPYSMRPVLDDPSQSWLQVDMKVPMSTALAVLALLNNAR